MGFLTLLSILVSFVLQVSLLLLLKLCCRLSRRIKPTGEMSSKKIRLFDSSPGADFDISLTSLRDLNPHQLLKG